MDILAALPFLSTLSLRRATTGGERKEKRDFISIHALLAESDSRRLITRRAYHISIHALLAESDCCWRCRIFCRGHFYPRSPCGERHCQTRPWALWQIFLSTLSLRRATHGWPSRCWLLSPFLSTLSLRRATHYDNYNLHCTEISIHALLAESDRTQSASLLL